MPRRVSLYIGLIAALAFVVDAGWFAADHPQLDWPWAGGLVMLVACVLLERRAVQMPGGNTVSIATIPHLVGILLLPAPVAISAAAIGILIDLRRLGEPWSRVIFNAANTTASVGIAAFVAAQLDVRGHHLVEGGLDVVGRFFVVIIAYYVINSVLLAGIMAVSTRRPFWEVLWLGTRSSAEAEVAVSVISGLAAFVWLTNAAWLPVVFFPMLIAQLTLDYLSTSDRKAREMEHLAFHDPLTGLPNRIALQRDLTLALTPGETCSPHVALLMVHLDGFKEVSDTFGYEHGDALLREVADRFKDCLGTRGEVAKLLRDEFAVLLEGGDVTVAQTIALELLGALGTPLSADGVGLFMAASVGIATCPEHGVDSDTLLRCADAAMFAAVEGHAGVAVYTSDLDSDGRERLALLNDFHVALTEGNLSLAYQPKIYARGGELHSVEALLRWTHPTLGPISPAVFVPLAEQAGLSAPLVRWVLDAALSQCRIWQDQGRDIRVCVNVSMYDLRDESFPDLVAERLAAYGASPSLVGIEVTESAAMADTARTRIALDRLHAQGMRISIDDFGTGYSSLAYLVGLPIDELKIDQSFVMGMARSTQHAAIVRSTIALGHDLNMIVVAEGVEDTVTLDRLRAFGCDLIQGYVLSRPISPLALEAWLDRPEVRVAAATAA